MVRRENRVDFARPKRDRQEGFSGVAVQGDTVGGVSPTNLAGGARYGVGRFPFARSRRTAAPLADGYSIDGGGTRQTMGGSGRFDAAGRRKRVERPWPMGSIKKGVRRKARHRWPFNSERKRAVLVQLAWHKTSPSRIRLQND